MKAIPVFAVCFLSLAYQAVADDTGQAVQSGDQPSLSESKPAVKTYRIGEKKVRHQTSDSKLSDRPCLPARNVGIAETAEHYYSSCKDDENQ